MERSRPLFRFDAGWLFVLAGLALVGTGAVTSSQRDRHELKQQLEELRHAERANFKLLEAYDRFTQDLEAGDPSLVRRLAAGQLNVMPKAEAPILMATSVNAPVSEWIDASVEVEPFEPEPVPDTLLARLTDGPRRLWALGAGAFLVFVGLVLTPAETRARTEASGS